MRLKRKKDQLQDGKTNFSIRGVEFAIVDKFGAGEVKSRLILNCSGVIRVKSGLIMNG